MTAASPKVQVAAKKAAPKKTTSPTVQKKAPAKKSVTAEKKVVVNPLSRADRIIKFIHKYIMVPEGSLVGKPMVLLPQQIDFIRAVYDNLDLTGKLLTRTGYLSIARKNGKSGLISAILGAHIAGPEAKPNAQLYSAARSRDQAALVFKYLAKSMRMNEAFTGLVDITDSGKTIKGLGAGTEYKALSADATTAHGLSPALTIHDELGQVVGPTDALYDALETAGGAQDEPLSLVISTQAAADSDLLSTLLDDAIRSPKPENVVHLHAAGPEDDVFSEETWYKSNFALGIFRSLKDMREMADKAKRMPVHESTFRNLYLNQRISRLSLMVAPSLWRLGKQEVNLELFYNRPVSIGLDLSRNLDLTAAVLSVEDDDGKVHVLPFVFTPEETMRERSQTDRAPYVQWAKMGKLMAVAGKVIQYDMVAEFLAVACEGMQIKKVAFDRWRIHEFKQSAERAGFAQDEYVQWQAVGQGYKDFSPRIEKFMEMLLTGQIIHGDHPVMNMAAANAVVHMDHAANKTLDKAKSSARIDPLVAAVMSVYATVVDEDAKEEKKKPVVTEGSLFFV